MSDEKPSLIMVSAGGLGNRLIPLLYAIAFSKNAGYNVYSLWEKDRTCDIECDEIFNQRLFGSISLDKICEIKPKVCGNIRGMNGGQRTDVDFYSKVLLEKNNSGMMSVRKVGPFLDQCAENNDSVFVDTYMGMRSKHLHGANFPEIFSEIIREEIKNKILKIKNDLNLNKEMIGCHLRGTDCLRKTGHCRKKIEKVIKIIKERKNQLFFVCSDEEEIEQRVSVLPNVVINSKENYVEKGDSEGNWSFNCVRSKESVLEALVDMCCLSFCDCSSKEYNSTPNSTFSGVARHVSGWENY